MKLYKKPDQKERLAMKANRKATQERKTTHNKERQAVQQVRVGGYRGMNGEEAQEKIHVRSVLGDQRNEVFGEPVVSRRLGFAICRMSKWRNIDGWSSALSRQSTCRSSAHANHPITSSVFARLDAFFRQKFAF